ncbi:hypothetical protein ZOSMA_22G01370 [Zostera marina]|uniref:Folate receptor-like domain-containing protein n=1 Tax=Zostera marina TaxID=29655 RepID=A0A0K9PKS2_ZOSMR|nr:hypothetical protein ZOSMA_22G01370 [Zostera marina]
MGKRGYFILLFLPTLLVFCCLLPSSGGLKQVCKSSGGRFPPFLSEGNPPGKVAKGPRDLVFCGVFRKYTCCDVAQTYPALVSVRKLASTGQANHECLHLWELLECSICDPRVGTQIGPPVICTSFCDSLWKACYDAFFSFDSKTQILSPCGLEDILCGAAGQWVSNGTELCRSAGFIVQPSEYNVVEKQFCYGGKMSLDSISESWTKSSTSELSRKTEIMSSLTNFQQWFKKQEITQSISWAVGGMVLTTGMYLNSRRKRYRQQQKHAAIIRAARR